jgi:hypothetical protein
MLYNCLRNPASILQARSARGALEGKTKTGLAQATAKASEHAAKLQGAVFRELGSVVTVEPKWSLEGVFPSRAVFKVAARHETRREWADLV